MEKKGSKKCLSDEEDKDERFLHLLFNKFIFQKKTVFEQMSAWNSVFFFYLWKNKIFSDLKEFLKIKLITE